MSCIVAIAHIKSLSFYYSYQSYAAHQNINKANKIRAQIKDTPIKSVPQTKTFAINDCVKYGAQRGKILSINGENCFVELDSGMRLKVKTRNLKPASNMPESPKTLESKSINVRYLMIFITNL